MGVGGYGWIIVNIVLVVLIWVFVKLVNQNGNHINNLKISTLSRTELANLIRRIVV